MSSDRLSPPFCRDDNVVMLDMNSETWSYNINCDTKKQTTYDQSYHILRKHEWLEANVFQTLDPAPHTPSYHCQPPLTTLPLSPPLTTLPLSPPLTNSISNSYGSSKKIHGFYNLSGNSRNYQLWVANPYAAKVSWKDKNDHNSSTPCSIQTSKGVFSLGFSRRNKWRI